MQQNGRIVSKCYLPAITGNRLQDLTFTRWDELAAVFDPRGGHTCGPAAAKADMSTREALLRRSEQQRFLRLMFVYTKCSGWFIQHFWSNLLSGVRIQQDPEDKDRSSQPFSLLCEMSVIFYFIDIVFGRQLALANEMYVSAFYTQAFTSPYIEDLEECIHQVVNNG
ncbi:hypothetical protein MJT46_003163 [Ovis ammon polii x Ovis aries]|nr:hypothetical protein MJT46_003163 [Ovis ammon polii x Ovis aries]